MVSQKMSRRQALKLLGGAAAGASVAGAFPAIASKASSLKMRFQSYEGRVVVFSTFDPMRYAPLVEAIEAAFPDVTVDWRLLPSERFVELFSAAEIAGDQIDIMDLNGQDLRRYALAGKMLDLSDTPYLDRFRPVGLETYTINDTLWALPRGGISGFTFLSNLKLLNDLRRPRSAQARTRSRWRVGVHAPRSEHLPVAGVAVLGVRANVGQSSGGANHRHAARRQEIHRPRTRRRARYSAALHRRRLVRQRRFGPR